MTLGAMKVKKPQKTRRTTSVANRSSPTAQPTTMDLIRQYGQLCWDECDAFSSADVETLVADIRKQQEEILEKIKALVKGK